MKFTKIMSLVLAIAMIAVCFVACGGNGGQTTTSSTTSSSTTSSSTTSSSTTSSSTTSSSTTTSTETPKPDPKPTEDVVLYENDFKANVDANVNAQSVFIKNEKLRFENWGNPWEKNIAVDNETGLIVITFDLYPNLQKVYDIVRINDVSVITAGPAKITVGGEDIGVKQAYGLEDVVRTVTIIIDPATGDTTVKYEHPDGAQWGECVEGTTNVGAISGEFKLSFRVDLGNGINGFFVDELVIVQAKAE